MEQNRELPVNVHFVVEGEEEVGSQNLPKFLEQNRDALRSDVAVVSDTGMVAPGVPTLSYGLRGVTALEVKVTGPKMDLHSGVFGGAVQNPSRLSRVCSRRCPQQWPCLSREFPFLPRETLEDWER